MRTESETIKVPTETTKTKLWFRCESCSYRNEDKQKVLKHEITKHVNVQIISAGDLELLNFSEEKDADEYMRLVCYPNFRSQTNWSGSGWYIIDEYIMWEGSMDETETKSLIPINEHIIQEKTKAAEIISHVKEIQRAIKEYNKGPTK